MIMLDYDNPIEITDGIYWTGYYNKESGAYSNSFLISDNEETILIDPGSIYHFPVVMRKVLDLVDPDTISTIITQHQGPDVCGNLMIVEDMIKNPLLTIAAHTITLNQVKNYGLRSILYPVDKNNLQIELASGRIIEFIFTPFMHSPGAINTYDPKTRSLFSGDIFSAHNKAWSLFASGDYLKPMDSFHQQNIPNNTLLKNCLKKIQKLNIDRIIPQHGSIIEGEDIDISIEHLKNLPCGTDLITEEL